MHYLGRGGEHKKKKHKRKRKKTCDDFWKTFGKVYECTPTPISKKFFPLNPLMPEMPPLEVLMKLKNH